MKPKIERIPKALKEFPQWVAWKSITEKGKQSKIPVDPKTGKNASVSEKATWGTFEESVDYCQKNDLEGIGFVFSPEDPFAGIDLDNCRDFETGKIRGWARKIIRCVDSYTEISPSGTGVKIFVRAQLPASGKRQNIELYDRGRFFTVTGDHVKGTPTEIKGNPKPIIQLYERLFASGKTAISLEKRAGLSKLSGKDIVKQAMATDEKFARLWNGNWSGYASRSEADLALAAKLANLTNGDRNMIDAFFRKSGLMRKKWDEKRGDRTYGQMTIDKALSSFGTSGQILPNPDTDQPMDRLNAYKTDPKTLIEKILHDHELLGRLAEMLLNDRTKFEIVLADLKTAKVPTRDIASLRGAVTARKRGLKRVSQVTPVGTVVEDCLPDAPVNREILNPQGWKIAGNGVFRITSDASHKTIAHCPVLIRGKLKDIVDKTEHVNLTWKKGEKWTSRILTREEVSDSRLLLRLSRFGFPVTSATARPMVEYLAAFEACNESFLPQEKVTHHLGWQGSKGKYGFLWGRKLITTTEETGTHQPMVRFKGRDSGEDQIASGFFKNGDFKEWRRIIPLIRDFPMVTFAVYASLSPPLLTILGIQNFIVDLASRTSSGKTTALRVAASCWGNPNENQRNSIVRSWDATPTWLERAPDVLKNLPLFVDDTQRAKNPELISKFIYSFSSGQGRGRGTIFGMQESGTWETVALSCGESKITSFTKGGGTTARALSIWGLPLKEKNKRKARLAREIAQIVGAHYGHAGPRFAKYLINHKEKWGKWKRQHLEIVKKYQNKAGESEVGLRQSEYLALIHMTAILSNGALRFPFDYENHLEKISKMVLAETSEGNRAEEAYEAVLDWALSQKSSFWGPSTSGKPPRDGWLGVWIPDGKKDLIAVLPHALKKFLRENGYEPDSITRTWADKGFLSKREKAGLTGKVTLEGERVRALFLRRRNSPVPKNIKTRPSLKPRSPVRGSHTDGNE